METQNMLPKSYLPIGHVYRHEKNSNAINVETPEQRAFRKRCAEEAEAAHNAGDVDAMWRWQALSGPSSPKGLRFLKRVSGADFIRKYGFDTSLADAEFGPGWLDQTEGDRK